MVDPKTRVVVIDDDKIILDIFARKFKDEGWDALCITDLGANVVDLARFNPDVILLDLMMPSLDGIEFFKTLRATESFKNIRIIFLTNNSDESKMTSLGEMQPDGFILKVTSTPGEVIKYVKDILKKAQS